MSSFEELPRLLYDARLVHTAWDRDTAGLAMTFETLRRNPMGGPLGDNCVTLRFLGLTAFFCIQLNLDLEWNLWLPAERQPTKEDVFAELDPAPPAPRPEVFVSVNSAADAFELSECAGFIRILGAELADYEHQPVRFSITTGMRSTLALYLGCQNIEITSAGEPLSVEQWIEECIAHWEQWREYWENRHEIDDDDETLDDELAEADEDDLDFSGNFPSDNDDSARFEGYEPPDRPPFVAGDTDIPIELLEPLQTWFEALHRRDWAAMACVHPDPDATIAERRDHFETAHTEWSAGRWVYVIAIKKWMIVGRRAYVLMDGIEHFAPGLAEPGDPAEDMQSDFSAELWHHDDRWCIRTLSV